MKTYYIEFERQGWSLAVIKVQAESYEQAKLKAFEALHATDEISEISEEAAEERVASGELNYILDENGDEIDIEDED